MASIITTEKGFKIIITTRDEINKLGSPGICDGCNSDKYKEGFYIAAMNKWYCPDCYNSWHNQAKYYPKEAMYENRNFNNMYNALIARAN